MLNGLAALRLAPSRNEMSVDICRRRCCDGKRQDMVARQRREINVGRRSRVGPDRFVDLLVRGDLADHIHPEHAGLPKTPALVATVELPSGRIEAGHPCRVPPRSRASAAMSSAGIALAARLHEGGFACAQQHAARLIRDQCATILIVAVSITRPRRRCQNRPTAASRVARRGRDGGKHARSTAARAECAEDSRTGSGRAR